MTIRSLDQSVALAVAMIPLLVGGCSGGGSSGSAVGVDVPEVECDGACAGEASVLTTADVERVIAQAVGEAQAEGLEATVAVVDRVGNTLAVFRMGDAASRSTIIASALTPTGQAVIQGGLEGIFLPLSGVPAAQSANLDQLAAISKAITGAFLSSEGNAFSTRTASQIVQQNFNPGENDQPSGPLFGVQFSQLACSDLNLAGSGVSAGPKRAPLGMAADPGGFPLYKGGTVVGGVGVLADGVYSAGPSGTERDQDVDERIALAATFGFAAPPNRRGDQITVEGKTFRFSDADFENLLSDPASAVPFAQINGVVGALVAVPGYTDGVVVLSGTAFGTAPSGIRRDESGDFPGLDAFIFVDNDNLPRFPPRAATDEASVGAAALTAGDVRTLLGFSLGVANNARAQIRLPRSTPARVTIAVVDTNGEVLGMVRGRDAPVFGSDVSLQKARTAVLLSSPTAGSFLASLPPAIYLAVANDSVSVGQQVPIGSYVASAQVFLADPTAFDNGLVAYSTRGLGNISRPFFPDGINGFPPGPFSKPAGQWSPFSTGLQLDVDINAVLAHVLYASGVTSADIGIGCAGVALGPDLSATQTIPASRKAANGLQIFPGGVPIYRGDVLVGGIGVSGDGVDQDDMIAFLGLHYAGGAILPPVNNASSLTRSDQLTPQGVRLRYVQCPQAPFLDDGEQTPCAGK